jgi:hypothetical protein
MGMQRKHWATLQEIFSKRVQAGILWTDIEALFRALGAEISEGRGSRVRVSLNGIDAIFHRPHFQKETDKGAVRSVQRFLQNAGVSPC